jgi:hypothetical protein
LCTMVLNSNAIHSYVLHSLTRNVSSDKAKALAAEGVEMVQANLFNKEDVNRAFENADIVFAVTNFWDPEIVGKDHSLSLEVQQGKNMADAAKENQVKWFLWSTLINVTKESGGKISHVDHITGNGLTCFFIQLLEKRSDMIFHID